MLIKRVLVVGYGSIGKRHLRLARELLPAADIRVLRHQACTSTPEYANGCFSAMEQALEFAPDVAVIANPAPFHIGIARLLADAGVHLLVEKPLSASVDGAEELIEACKRNAVVLLTGYNLRFLPSLQRFRDLVKQGSIGKVLSVRCEIGQYLPSWRPDSDYRLGVSARRELGGGVLLELSHEIDYLRWIFGEISSVRSHVSQQSNLEIDVEDCVHITMRFKQSQDAASLVGTLNMDFFRHDTTRLCTAIGEHGSLRWNGLTGVVDEFRAGAAEWRQVFHHQHQRDDSYVAEWQNFLCCVKERRAPLISGEDGFKVLKIIEAIRQSAKLECDTLV